MREELTLVTGAGGFVGSAVVKRLLRDGVPVRAMVRSAASAKELSDAGAEISVADLLDEGSINAAVAGVGRVIHIAALFRSGSVTDEEFGAVNVEGTRKLLDAACREGVKRFIHCSTIGVHGHIANPPATEEAPFSPGDPYQRSKLAGELLARSYFEQGRINGAVIRPAMVYGPHDRRTRKLFRMVKKGSFFFVGAGEASVHFVDVRDLANGFLAALRRPDLNNQVYILAGESPYPLRDVTRLVAALYGVNEPRLHLPVGLMQLAGSVCEKVCAPFGVEPPIFRRRVNFFTKDRAFDCSKARNELNYKPEKNLVGELLDIITSYDRDGSVPLGSGFAPSVMVRDLEGKIEFWNEKAEGTYGWSRTHALGSISHELLRTEFPKDLQVINRELLASALWRGELVHRRINGDRVAVRSHWQMLSRASADPLIAEVNRVQRRKVSPPVSAAAVASGLAAALGSQELLSWIVP